MPRRLLAWGLACAAGCAQPQVGTPHPSAAPVTETEPSEDSISYPYHIALRGPAGDTGRWGPIGYIQVEPSKRVVIETIEAGSVERVQACLDRINAEKMLSYTVPPPAGMDGSYGEFVNRESDAWALGVEDSVGELCHAHEVQVDGILQRFEQGLGPVSGFDVAYVIAAQLYAARTVHADLATLDPDSAIATAGTDAYAFVFESGGVSVRLEVLEQRPGQETAIQEQVGEFWVVGEATPPSVGNRVTAAAEWMRARL